MTIPDAACHVPMMFRAQVDGRCQLQRIPKDKKRPPDVIRWASEWVERSEVRMPEFGPGVNCREYKLTWRFVTNGGQDDGVIRPVIGTRGIPFYPGSSMKGAFRQACRDAIASEKVREYCGDDRTLAPGILRFHGGYPTSADWTKQLVDIVHPQQDWQVQTHETSRKSGGAFVQISLYQPELRFGISSTQPLEPEEWEIIWQVWERALASGLGCRVCAGYGQPETHTEKVLCRLTLRGQGAVSRLLDRTAEFRPNIFRAGLRGHALRIFGGLTNANQAEALVERLFGGISRDRGTQVGLLAMAFRELKPPIVTAETYDVTGELFWLLTQSVSAEEAALLKKLVKQLMQFAMLLGGFGKSWRRANHRLFSDYEKYEIGCHWSWAGNRSPLADNPARRLEDVKLAIDRVRATAIEWMNYQGQSVTAPAAWREVWHPTTVQVWGRVAEGADESEAIEWLHGKPYSADEDAWGRSRPRQIKRTSITGGNINGSLHMGRLWHRMYPIVLRKPDPKYPDRTDRFLPKPTPRYLELLTLFPDGTEEFDRFIDYLDREQDQFQLLWGDL
jgi:CRISPR-associated protein Cmr6